MNILRLVLSLSSIFIAACTPDFGSFSAGASRGGSGTGGSSSSGVGDSSTSTSTTTSYKISITSLTPNIIISTDENSPSSVSSKLCKKVKYELQGYAHKNILNLKLTTTNLDTNKQTEHYGLCYAKFIMTNQADIMLNENKCDASAYERVLEPNIAQVNELNWQIPNDVTAATIKANTPLLTIEQNELTNNGDDCIPIELKLSIGK